MKIAIHTEALGPIHSGGIRCIVYFLNMLKDRGHDVCAFVDRPPFDSTWLPSHFPVYPYDSDEYKNFDRILISPYSPTSHSVAKHKKASTKIIWAHTFEGAFEHNGPAWMKRAISSYKLKEENLYYMATSHYVSIILKLIFKQDVLPYLVPGGVDSSVFRYEQELIFNKMRADKVIFCMLNRPEPVRGLAIAKAAFDELSKLPAYKDKFEVRLFAGLPQEEMYKAYGSAHYFVDPSLLAGLPLPPLEAMVCGCVPVVTEIGANDYINDELNGFIINSNDVKHTMLTLKECIDTFFDDDDGYARIMTEAYMTAKQWTWGNMIYRFEENMKHIGVL